MAKIEIEKLEQLPCYLRQKIPARYIDRMGHMNVRWYMALFNEAAWEMYNSIGMDEEYIRAGNGAMMAFHHFISYMSEVRQGESVELRTRMLGLSAKRCHFMHFMVNRSRNLVSATIEILATHANPRTRRTSPFPAEHAAQLRALLKEHQQLDWEPPLCGLLSA